MGNILPMLKIKLLLVFILSAWTGVFAQTDFIVQGTTPDLYLMHSVAAKETWYSIGRLFNLSPAELAPYNSVTLDKPLRIGQQVKIPLKSTNFSQNEEKGTDETFVPVYHIIQEKEWLYRISVNHNKVPVEALEKWNNINKDQARAGLPLIVGYLKVKSTTELARTGGIKPPVVNIPVTREPEVIAKKTDDKQLDQPVKKETQSVRIEEVKQPAADVKKDEVIPAVSKPEVKAEPANFKGGYFRSQFEQNNREASGISGVFKSTSGWNDGKYYALMNGVPVGTIVKVNFPSTNKSIYAKVLGQLPQMRESSGLTIRISDAAAAELGAGNNKFTVDVQF